ncbi:archaellin/type IV pilin N-terminal domain-containing protein [Halobacterium salinarum]|uniref:Flagellin n=1 Tax=Halobacterium salinarum (strain ATCC 33171 / DSM 3754 / JCM 8978 / NBRC 102687 / NCIMB 764 / 91-R6) TaxID=2597657 RepID=A0A4D6GWX2_HALS9|nr:archaellin/type IV pilin N-terminal domain-containing protein [Halobacterium salinarum]MCF2206976.1 flagellin [Halobacterium salinarum]MCF2240545.1 flagellin [Halobacterium salinarum]QCC45002.1 archaellin ArlX [Halobacterium salinarum]TYO76115.1 flagellin FlaA [Halobacterium salinarum DSM 3754]
MESMRRGQVGIGTLVVFMAMILVAAMAASTLVDIGGMLQSRGDATGEEAVGQVTNGVSVTGAFGTITNATDDPFTDGTVSDIEIVVGQSAGSGNVNVSDVTVDWVGPRQATTLSWTDGTANSSRFTTRKTTGSSATVLADAEDRIEIVINATAVEENQDSFSGTSNDNHGLYAGERAELVITTQYGASTTYWVSVPESVTGASAVSV